MSTLAESRDNEWFSPNFRTYLLLKPGADYEKLLAKFPAFMKKRAGPQLQSVIHLSSAAFEKNGNYFRLNLIPLKKIHLQSNIPNEFEANGNIVYVYIFSAIALFILLIACVNFMNLSTARSANRAREVGVRKVLGASRKYLIAQFLTESILLTLAGALIAVFAAWALLPLFNQMSGKELIVTWQVLGWLAPFLLVIIIVIGCLAGSYPALFLSGFNPVDVIKGNIAAGFKGARLRSLLVVFQFAISIFLIIGTMVIYNQLKYIQNKDMGYNRSHVLIVKNIRVLGNAAKIFKQEVKQLPGVQNATLADALPTNDNGNTTSYFMDAVIDQKRAVLSHQWNVDEDYIPTLGIKIAAGRNFSKQMITDSTGVIINQAFAKLLNYQNAVDRFLYTTDNRGIKMNKYRIIGVMKDFNFLSLRDNVTPLLFNLNENGSTLSMQIKTENIPALLIAVKNQWKQLSPNQEFNYSFMHEDFDALYRSEQRMGVISIAFTSLAIIIACLGLFGLAAYAAEQRNKEIGIRKILGASVSTIVGMLSIDFIKLVLISIFIATPLAWWVMNKWLQDFAYKVNIQWYVLAFAGIIAIFIAFFTISFQSIRAALSNPVKSLRSE